MAHLFFTKIALFVFVKFIEKLSEIVGTVECLVIHLLLSAVLVRVVNDGKHEIHEQEQTKSHVKKEEECSQTVSSV